MIGRGTLVYVHGASDRPVGVADHVARIERGLAGIGLPLTVVASQWGEAVGAKLDDIHLSLPDALGGAGPPSMLETEEALDRLTAVMNDGPLSELERLGAGSQPALVPQLMPEREADRLLAIARTTPPQQPSPVGTACRSAAMAVEGSPEYARARCADVPEAELVGATARAVAATAAASVPPTDLAPELGAQSIANEIEIDLAQAVIAAAAATLLAGYFGVDVGPGLKRWATDVLVPHRTRLMQQSFLGPADALHYLADGDAIRRFVSDSVASAIASGGPVVALGNSLGGVILVEALAAAGAPHPDLLVTVGSQAPLLKTVGALPGVPDRRFQPWLNIYDRRDFAGFVATPVWPGEPGIRDVAVDSGLGFPDSHGATYLSLPAVYEAIRDQLGGD